MKVFFAGALSRHNHPHGDSPPTFTPRHISSVARKCDFPQRNNPPIAPIRTSTALRSYGRSKGQSCFTLFFAVVREKAKSARLFVEKHYRFLGNSARIAPAHNNLIANGSLWKTFRESLLVSRKTFCAFHIFRPPYYRQDSRSKRRARLYPRRQLLVDTKKQGEQRREEARTKACPFCFSYRPRFDRTTLFRGLTDSHSITMAIIITAIRLRLTLRRNSDHIFSPKTLRRSLSTQVNKRTKSNLIDFLH